MNFEFTEEQRALQETVRRFVEKEMHKHLIAQWDQAGEFPDGLLDKMAEIGLIGASVPEAYGCTGGGVMEETIILEESSRQRASGAMAYGATRDEAVSKVEALVLRIMADQRISA